MKGYGQELTGANTGDEITGPGEPGNGPTARHTNNQQILPGLSPMYI